MVKLTFKIRTHLTTDSPKPDIAPYLPATVLVIQYAAKKPNQLNTKATIGMEPYVSLLHILQTEG